jgi:hypothetical protein
MMNIDYRTLLKHNQLKAACFALLLGISNSALAAQFMVHKSPTCGCCTAWVDYMSNADHEMEVETAYDLRPIKAEFGVPAELVSCHTAVSESGLVIEGHVPVDIIERLEADPVEGLLGVSVPAMQPGSPGMEGPNAAIYPIVGWFADGRTVVLERRQGETSAEG